jgi:hypothetical protein
VDFSMWQPVPVTYCLIFKNVNVLVVYISFHAHLFVTLGCVLFKLTLLGFYMYIHLYLLIQSVECLAEETKVLTIEFLAKFLGLPVIHSLGPSTVCLAHPLFVTVLSCSWPVLNLFNCSRIACSAGLIFDLTSDSHCNHYKFMEQLLPHHL